jgi:phosphoglycolate phosphatase-like HAD superfamily hydrolase
MRSFNLIVFDWNGTLQNDMPDMYECGVRRFFRHFGLPCPSIDTWRNEVTADFMPSFYWPHGIPRDVTAEQLSVILAEGFKERGALPELFPDSAALVRTLALRGYDLAIASGCMQIMLDEHVVRSGLGRYFFRVDGGVRDKAEALTSIIDQAGVKGEECAIIGDTTEEVLAAKEVGATPFICTRGFHSVERIEAVRAQEPKLVVRSALFDFLTYFP